MQNFFTIFIRITLSSFIAWSSVNFMINASKVHLFFCDRCIFYTKNTFIKFIEC